tara:strand:- start:11389 stop:12288 length:900 start_codon:yes stop_codon:yes gene_type:complete
MQNDIESFFNRVGLKVGRVSKDEYSVYCPWHADDNASLFVNPSKGVYHCFAGCVKGSNGIGSLLKKMGSSTDVQFFMQFPDLIVPDEEEEEEVYIDINVEKLPLAEVNEYLRRRYITEKTVKAFNIKYHLGYDALIVPINNKYGEFVGYIRRNLSSNPKYMNAKGMDVSHLLFPFDKFEAIDGQVVVVEGLFDAIRAHQEGFTNVVSTIGGEIKRNQLSILMEYAKEIVLCPDRDKEGVRLAEKNLSLLRKYGVPVGFTRPSGASKDLAEVVRLDEMPVTPDFLLEFGSRSISSFLGVK